MYIYRRCMYIQRTCILIPSNVGTVGGIWGTQIAWARILAPLVTTCVTWASDLTNLS